jgi:hypothetical protein
MIAAIVTQITFAATAYRPEMVIRQVNAVGGESSWKAQTDTCTIVLPRNTITFDRYKVSTLFRRGDAVKVEMGINGTYAVEFQGYISESPSVDIPVEIKCQDEMWKLKQLPVSVSLRAGAKLPDLIKKILPTYTADVLEIDLPADLLRFSNTTVAEVLEKIKSVTGLPSYFQNGKLIVAKVYADNSAAHEVDLDGYIVANNLKYRKAEDRKIKVKAVSTNESGKKKLTVEVGDEGGEMRQLSYTGITDEKTLKALAERELAKYKVDGYEGTIESFANMTAQHGDKLKIKSSKTYPDRDGTYYVDARKWKMDDSPQYHVTLEVGPKAVD